MGRCLDLDRLAFALRGRVHARRDDRVKRPLGERREGSDLLDLVAEELDSQRLAARRREDVDDSSPNRELSALVDPIHALVPRPGECLREPVETGLRPHDEIDGAGSYLERRHPLGESCGRCTHESAAREHVEAPRALTDEMRRRLESRGVRDPPTREQRDVIRAEKPRSSLGRITGIGVLGQEDQKAASELLVERSEHERQRGLRHSRPARQGLRERLKPIAAGEFRDESVKGCLVHANDGNRSPRAYPSAAPEWGGSATEGAGAPREGT